MEWLFSWEVVSVVVALLVSIGLGVLALVDFKWAKLFFLLAAADAIGGIAMGGTKSTLPTWATNVVVVGLCGMVGFLTLQSLRYVDGKKELKEHAKSVLVLQPLLIKGGPKNQWTVVDLDIKNPPEDAIQNLDWRIRECSNRIVSDISQITPGIDCKLEPLYAGQDQALTFKGSDGSRLTLDAQDAFSEQPMRTLWRLFCGRISGNTTLRLQLTIGGDAEKDSIHVSGSYERIPSKGSAVVKVDETILIP